MNTPKVQSNVASDATLDDGEHHEPSRRTVPRRSVVSEGPGLLDMVAGDDHEEAELRQNSSSIIK